MPRYRVVDPVLSEQGLMTYVASFRIGNADKMPRQLASVLTKLPTSLIGPYEYKYASPASCSLASTFRRRCPCLATSPFYLAFHHTQLTGLFVFDHRYAGQMRSGSRPPTLGCKARMLIDGPSRSRGGADSPEAWPLQCKEDAAQTRQCACQGYSGHQAPVR